LPIRQATLDDATAIAQLKNLIWVYEDEIAALSQIESSLQNDIHQTFVATDTTGIVIGFVDGFMTQAYDGRRRWEVDLLAVHPDFRGRGVAKELLEASIERSKTRGADILRGLIHTHNTASARAFQGVGFQTDGRVYHLHITTEYQPTQHPAPAQLHIIPVETLTYSGLWAENCFTKEALHYCQSLVTPQHLVGMLIPDQEQVALNYAKDLEFTNLGSYCWWVYAQD
jgi:ribosomal protein S18 acetylase RimI-like enzyme